MDKDWNVIFSYMRKQAIEDGVLIDITNQAKQTSMKVNTCVTDHLYGDYLVPPAGLEGEGQSLEGRLHDLLFRTLIAASTHGAGGRVEFEVLFLMSPGEWAVVITEFSCRRCTLDTPALSPRSWAWRSRSCLRRIVQGAGGAVEANKKCPKIRKELRVIGPHRSPAYALPTSPPW